jgi:hypothetical protein
VREIFDHFFVLQSFPDRKSWDHRVAAAELASLNGQETRISEQEIALAYNLILAELRLPEYKVAPEQIHQIRLGYSHIYPKLFGRKDDGSISEGSRPVEAALVLLQFDNTYSDQEVPARLKSDKAASAEYEASVERYDRAKAAWAKEHKNSDLQRIANRVAATLHVQ